MAELGSDAFSLGKHLTMIGLVFVYFASRGRSRAAIQAGLVQARAPLLIDWIPVLAWLGESGATSSWIPPIALLALVSCALSAVGLWLNARHPEWSTT